MRRDYFYAPPSKINDNLRDGEGEREREEGDFFRKLKAPRHHQQKLGIQDSPHNNNNNFSYIGYHKHKNHLFYSCQGVVDVTNKIFRLEMQSPNQPQKWNVSLIFRIGCGQTNPSDCLYKKTANLVILSRGTYTHYVSATQFYL